MVDSSSVPHWGKERNGRKSFRLPKGQRADSVQTKGHFLLPGKRELPPSAPGMRPLSWRSLESWHLGPTRGRLHLCSAGLCASQSAQPLDPTGPVASPELPSSAWRGLQTEGYELPPLKSQGEGLGHSADFRPLDAQRREQSKGQRGPETVSHGEEEDTWGPPCPAGSSELSY